MGSELRLYDVTVGAHKTRMRLDDRDAQAMGDGAVLVAEPQEQPQPAAPLPYRDPVAGKARLVTDNKTREPGAHTERGAS